MTDKEIFKAELDRLKEETSIGLSEHDNGVEQGRMEVVNALYKTLDHMQEEPVSEDFKQFEETYLDKEKNEILCIYDRHAGLVDGAKWQKQQMMNDAVSAYIRRNRYTKTNVLNGFDVTCDAVQKFKDKDKVKVIIIKDE